MLIIKRNKSTLTMSRNIWFVTKIDGRSKWKSSMTSMTSEHERETVETIDRLTVRERGRF
jgi:hypothetical protein